MTPHRGLGRHLTGEIVRLGRGRYALATVEQARAAAGRADGRADNPFESVLRAFAREQVMDQEQPTRATLVAATRW